MTAHKNKANELVIFDTVEKNLWHVLFTVTVIHKRCMIFMNIAPVAVQRLNMYFSNEKCKGTRGNP